MRLIRSNPSLVLLLTLPLACAQGSDDPGMLTFTGFPPAEGGNESGGESGTDGESATSGQTSGSSVTVGGVTSDSSGSADDGNPMCCMISADRGCDSADTEACVCTSLPSCCQQVWGEECVELAIACGDPYCTDDSGDSTGDPPPECPNFEFIPQNPAPNAAFQVIAHDPEGLTYIGMYAEGPGGTVQGVHTNTQGSMGDFRWTFDFNSGLSAGLWTFNFTWHVNENDPDIIRDTCQKQF